jgi:hypothetical protein
MEYVKRKLKENWKKILGISVIILVICMILHMTFPMNTDLYGLELSILLKTFDIRLVAGITVYICFLIVIIVFVLIQDTMPGKKLIKGFTYGCTIAILWTIGFLELVFIYNSPLIYELTCAMCDGIPLVILGLLAGKYLAADNENKLRDQKRVKNNIISILIIGLFVTLGRYFSYIILNIESGYLINPIGTFFWTLSLGLLIGIMYCLFEQGLKGTTSINRTIFFSLFIFGVNWALYTFFWPILYEVSLIEVIIRLGFDLLYVFIGTFIIEKFIK